MCLQALLLALACFTLISGAAETAPSTNNVPAAPTNHCAQFTLQDQFGTNHQFTFPQSKPVLLTVADKKGSADIKDWAHPLGEKFGDQITIAGLADVSTVPGPLRGLVRSKFKKAFSYPVMLDWDGAPTRSFNYIKGEANVYLIAPDGRILNHMSGSADADRLKDLGASLDAVLAKLQPSMKHPQAGTHSGR